MGTAILSDENGWMQKISMSYSLLILPEYDENEFYSTLAVTNFAVNNLQLRVARATFKTEIRPPQFRIRRTQLSVEPGIGTLFQTVEGYRDGWTTRNPQPSDLEYQMMPGSTGKESFMSAQLDVAANPGAHIEIGRKSSSTKNTHAMGSILNLNTVECAETPYGGLSWEYDIKKEAELAYLQLQRHSGQSITPKSHPPSGMDAKLSTIFDIANNKGISLPKFQNRSSYRGISIGYRQCKIDLKVNIPWAGDKVTEFPDPGIPSSGHQLYVKHQFRGGCENTIKPEIAVLGQASMEMAVEGT
jgi:hypothetical protein